MDIGTRIRLLREEHNLTQSEFGKIFGIGKSTVSMYENNKSVPDDELKTKIADYFDVSLDWLMGRSSIRNPYKCIGKAEKIKESEYKQILSNEDLKFIEKLLEKLKKSKL
jgi:transcriptional regulator with XRE-family HTH domain